MVTTEEFLQLDLADDQKYELDRGEIVQWALPKPDNEIARRIHKALYAWARDAGAGRVYEPNTPYVVGPNVVRVPDGSFVRQPRLEGLDPDKPIPGAPDLAIEVASASERRSQLWMKISEYLTAGGEEVWIVYPNTQTVWAIVERDDRMFGVNDTIESPALPGFSVKVSEFFNDPEE